ncbi:MAG TPA: apolipoprotein N-acyltransferase [Saprospiraceae bacterium]|nr:apolipoprotein N-acyltransferase [Saprospiraceae bacterium]
MPEQPSSTTSRIPRLAFTLLLLATCALASWRMFELPLWGWWPLLMLLSLWGAIVMIFFPKDPTEKKWLGSATLSGVLLGLGFPPSPLTFVVIFAWIPLLAVETGIYQHKDKIQPGKVFLYSYHAFVLWNIIATFWVTNTALIAGFMAIFVNAAFMATVMMMIHIVQRKLPFRYSFLVFISFWISFEYLHHVWELSWPWLALGNTLAEYPWAAQWYEFTGAFGGSLWILALNLLGYYTILRWLRAKPLRLWQYASLLLIPIMVSLGIWFTIKESNAPEVNITIVQPNYEPHYEKFEIPEDQQSRRFFELSMARIDSTTQYLVFPETSFDYVHLNAFRNNRQIRLFQSMIDSFPNLRLVTGISSQRTLDKNQLKDTEYRIHVTAEGDTVYWDAQNSAVQMTSGQQDYQIYFKSKLVPGPEILPYRKVLFFLKPIVEKLEGTVEGNTRQKERSVFTGGPLTVAPIICYESIYGAYVGEYVKKGATALFIVTNDGWWDNTPGHIQHLKIGSLRAIEHRRPIARSANSGISAFIDIKGRIHSPTRYGETISMTGKLKPETRITLYTLWGDVIPNITNLLTLFLLLAWIYFRIRRKAILV